MWWGYDTLNWDGWGADNLIRLDFSIERALATDADALIRYLDERLTGRRLSPAQFTSIRECVERYDWPSLEESRDSRVRVAYYLILQSPAGAVLK